MTTTPPLAASVRTPPAPQHGPKHDSYQPYATRKSTRQQRQRVIHSTPPPPDDNTSSLTPPTSKATFSPPATVRSSPKKKKPESRRTASGRLTDDGTASAAAALGISPDVSFAPALGPTMLPTPAKTPQKRREAAAPALSSTARILFPSRPDSVDDVMPSPRKKRSKRHNVLFDDEAEAKIEIFTDSKDRGPELDTSAANPFYEGNSTSKTRAKRSEDVQEAIDRDEGMIYVL